MEQDLKKLLITKTNYKTKLRKLSDEYLLKIYSGFIQNKTPKQISKELYDLTINSEVKNWEAYDYANKVITNIYKRLPQQKYIVQVAVNNYPRYVDNIKYESDAVALIVFGLMDSIKAYPNLKKIDNQSANKMESVVKETIINSMYGEARAKHQVFYLSSEHKDCAKDHLEAQGKIFIDRYWKNYVSDEEKLLINNYINANNTQTIQNITDKPVYLITRPNCRHYFKALDTQEVLKNSTTALIKKYKMKKVVGDRQYMQTYEKTSNETRALIGDYRNAQLMVDRYKQRLKFHEALYNYKKIPLLKDAIVKDKFLIKKWEQAMRKAYRG